jgi:periplasmic protein TonB
MTFDSADTRGIATRRLRYAIAASLALHLLVLWPDRVRQLTKDAPSLLHATLRARSQPVAESAPAPPPLPAKAPQAAAAAAPTLASPARTPDTPSLESPKSAPVPQVPPAVVDSGGAKPVPAAAPSAPAAVSGGLLTEGAASGEAADGLRGYRLAVAVQARRFKRYPAQAMASGWAGTAEVRIEVGSDGRPRPATIARSSGHEVLDRAALTTIDAGALRARLPDSLRGKAFAVVLPVVFNLDEE